MLIEFSGRRVVVAGASRGIGRSIALAFAKAGAGVSICARGADALAATEAEIATFGNPTHAAVCDLSQREEIERYIADAAEKLGGIDILVNNATAGSSDDSDVGWDASLGVDLLASVRASRVAVPHLLRGTAASIINIASGSGLNPSVRTPAYGAAKAAVIHYTRTQAAALARSGIRVNCVAPGSIEFPGGSWERRRADNPALYNSVLAASPAGRLGTPEEVANVVLFLASPFANWVTAQIIGVNGGQGLRGA
jgi:3-oxoacyl-[acyl-carrier protein] reductase